MCVDVYMFMAIRAYIHRDMHRCIHSSSIELHSRCTFLHRSEKTPSHQLPRRGQQLAPRLGSFQSGEAASAKSAGTHRKAQASNILQPAKGSMFKSIQSSATLRRQMDKDTNEFVNRTKVLRRAGRGAPSVLDVHWMSHILRTWSASFSAAGDDNDDESRS